MHDLYLVYKKLNIRRRKILWIICIGLYFAYFRYNHCWSSFEGLVSIMKKTMANSGRNILVTPIQLLTHDKFVLFIYVLSL
jgi:hypothetical protein